MGRFWYRHDVQRRWQKRLMSSLVTATLISGLETTVLTNTEHRLLEKTHMRYARALLHGDALNMTNEQVRLCLNMPTLASLLRVRRLQWLRQMIVHLDCHEVVFAALLGHNAFDASKPFDDSKHIHDRANPWVQQWNADFELFAIIDSNFAREFQRHGFIAALTSNAFRNAKLRALLTPLDDRRESAAVPLLHTCHFPVDGHACGRNFNSAQGLLCHERRAHGIVNWC